MERKKNPKSPLLAYSIADFIDLSLVEILTLELLIRHSEPTVRHTLYNEVSQFLLSERTSLDTVDLKKLSSGEKRYFNFLQNKKKLSTSSFYNSLKNLETRGLIKSNYNVRGKIDTIEMTNLTNPLIDVVLKHFIRFGIRTEYTKMEEMKEFILSKVNRAKFDSVLVIWLNEFLDLRIFRMAHEVSDTMLVLSKSDFTKDLIQSGLQRVGHSTINNDQIREPNKSFDLVFFPFFYKESDILGLNTEFLLREAKRVTKRGGIILITAQIKLPKAGGYLADKLLEMYEQANQQTIYEESELEDYFNRVGITKTEIINFGGELIGIGYIS